MGLLETVKAAASGLLKPVGDIIDDLHTSDEEKLVLKAQLATAQGDVEARLYESETARIESVNATMRAESASDGALTKNWRPLFGISFGLQMWAMFILIMDRGMEGVEMIKQLPDMYWFSNLGVLGVVAGGRTWEKISKYRNGNGKRVAPLAGG